MRVEETADGGSERANLGTISKANLEVSPEIRSAASPSEATEIDRVVEFYKHAEVATRLYFVAKFPEVVREVMEHYEAGASETEKQLIASAITEAARRIRRGERRRVAA